MTVGEIPLSHFWKRRLASSIKASSLLTSFCLFVALLQLTSCIEGEEEIWVNSDASGRAKLRITAPTVLFSKFGGAETLVEDAKTAAEDSDQVEILAITASKKGSRTTLSAELTFQDARRVGSFLQTFRDPATPLVKSDPELVVGDVALAMGFPDYHYDRKIDLAPLLAEQAIPPFALNMIGEDARLSYILHLPTAVTTSNADAILDDGKTLKWDQPVSRLLEGPVEMSFAAPLPLPYRLIAVVALLLISLLAVIVSFVRKRGRRNTQATQTPTRIETP